MPEVPNQVAENDKDTMQNPSIQILADGDLILIVGPQQVKIRVYSAVLKLASKPFAAMLGPMWAEGAKMALASSNEPAEIEMPDDDAQAMECIYAIIHHKYAAKYVRISPNEILRVAVTADKYDFMDTLQHVSNAWIDATKSWAVGSSDLILLAAAYPFRNSTLFFNLTRKLILECDRFYLAMSCPEVDAALPLKIFCHLEQARSVIRGRLAECLFQGIQDAACRIDVASNRSFAEFSSYLAKVEHDLDLSPHSLFRNSVCDTIKNAREVLNEEIDAGYTSNWPDMWLPIIYKMEQVKDEVGLCLHCVRMNNSRAFDCEIQEI